MIKNMYGGYKDKAKKERKCRKEIKTSNHDEMQ